MARDEKIPAKAKTHQQVSTSFQATRRGRLSQWLIGRLHVRLPHEEGKICAIVSSAGR
jgi:hypothetical protein